MSLIDQLRESVAAVPPSHIPTTAEALGVLGALICHAELGDEFLKASQVEDPAERIAAIDALLAPPEPEPAVAPAVAPAPSGGVTTPATPEADPRDVELAQLRQQVQNLLGERGRTQVEVTPATAPTEGPAS